MNSDQSIGMETLSSSGQAAQPSVQNLRGEASEALVQTERFTSQVSRLTDIIVQIGLREQLEKVPHSDEQACNPNDLNWTIRTTASTIRVANDQLEELLNTMESELL